MTDSIELNEILKLLNCETKEPHNILGMHDFFYKGKPHLVVRSLMPSAKFVYAVNRESSEKYFMKRVNDDGYFEVIIDEENKFDYYLEVHFAENNIWVTEDQYKFLPTISEYDRYLFGAGTHYDIYKKLGSHIKEIDGVKGVSFAVWAPNAQSISVVGSFNNWDRRRNIMGCLKDSGIWELFIPEISTGDIYKYSVKNSVGDIVCKSDPYGNFFEVRPKNATVVYNTDDYSWSDKVWLKKRETMDIYNMPLNIYELHLGSWIGCDNRYLTYRELADKLVEYVKYMGYTHVEFMPVMEHPFDGSWGYQVTGYFAPTSRYGTPIDFKYLIDTLHKNEIGVILDWVPAHFPRDSHGLAYFDGGPLYEYSDPIRGEHPQWGTNIFNYEKNEVKNFLISNVLFWINEYHVDGIRVDAVASMLYLDYCRDKGKWKANKYGRNENLEAVEFIKHLNSVVKKSAKGIIMIAEESTSWEGVTKETEKNGLGFDYKWSMGWMNDNLSYLKRKTIHRKHHHNDITFSMMYAFSEKYILPLSHDEVVHMKGAMANKPQGDLWQKLGNVKAMYGFMYSHPGKKLMFMGNEIGQFSEWSEEGYLDWYLLDNPIHKKFQHYVKELNHLYLREESLWKKDFTNEGFIWIDCDDTKRSVVSYMRCYEHDCLIIVCNFTETFYEEFIVGVSKKGIYKEIFNSDRKEFGGSNKTNEEKMKSVNLPMGSCDDSIRIKLPPLGFVVFKADKKK